MGSVAWLAPPNLGLARTAKSDTEKRKEIFLEFLYYLFDSFLIPLIRSNFHVTESNVHHNRLFYFRHDVWRAATETAITGMKASLFEEVKTSNAKKLLDARTLGFSQIRLLPKAKGVRPITNLRRRVTKLQNGRVALGRSINSIMAPVFNVLEFEKSRRPGLVGSALFSVGDMYPKLKTFANKLRLQEIGERQFYFAKADAKSCFETIPQRKVVKLMGQIASDDRYRIARHAEIKSTNVLRNVPSVGSAKPARKFISTARAATDFVDFEQFINAGRTAQKKKNTIFVDSIVQTTQRKENVLDLLEEHIQRNLIKVGKKFFRQKTGIPQGSVLSSLLCTYFYAGLEKECLAFLKEDESILLRLIDDFLLISTNKAHATKFLQIMHDGIETYGVEINPAKSLANYDVIINGTHVPQLTGSKDFPYCGNSVNIRTLEITKDRERRKATGEPSCSSPGNAVTNASCSIGRYNDRRAIQGTGQDVLSKSPEVLNVHPLCLTSADVSSALKIQIHKMFLDTNFNSPKTVLSTIYQNFIEAAMKYYRYVKSMVDSQQPHLAILTGKKEEPLPPPFCFTAWNIRADREWP